MSFQNFKSDSQCVGGRHRSATKNNYCDITSKVGKVLIGYCSISYRKKSMTASNKTIQSGSFGDFFKNLGEKGLDVSKKCQKT